VEYQPAELYITSRAGTTLAEIESALESEGQVLSFEPPRFGGGATLGGTLASNLSGPARPWNGSVRDMAMGVQLVNGRGELLRFGGRVVKNVAGYDVTRLQAGALGTLGILTEITVKVMPRPEQNLTLAYEMDCAPALEAMNRRSGEPKPLTGACWLQGRLYLRLSGIAAAVEQTARQWGGERLSASDVPWEELREQALPFFAQDAPLWRFSVQSTAAPGADTSDMLVDWGGAQRWLRGRYDRERLRREARAGGGHVALYRGGDRRGEVQPDPGPLGQAVHRRLKRAFDPDGLLNPGRLYGWL